ncbi:ionotropic receptor 21a-like [Rhynchophorus ferrugineus]|uniref:ionotropic receptor 21a-like n=1 Tax=Rhynchophorus ferrugineus TaxID=354439 RepID=UPI003FCD7D81
MYLSFIMINIDDNIDEPDVNGTENSLIMAREHGCKMYIIFLENGQLVKKLLKFGDKYRLFDTNSKYIILYDHVLFQKDTFYIWKRLINVIFIKKYESKNKVYLKNKSVWFEITTVPYPMNAEGILVPRRLDIWTNNKFRKDPDFFKDKTLNLKNETLKVVTFAHIPGTVKTNNSLDQRIRALFQSKTNQFYSGTEVEILKTVSQYMNFHCNVYEAENADIELWGNQMFDNNYTGLLGEMLNRKADIALGDLYYVPFVLYIMDLTIPYNTECLTFLTPESLTDISWKTLILPFSPLMWALVVLCLLISSSIFHYLAKFHLYIHRAESDKGKRTEKHEQESKIFKKQLFNNLSLCSQIKKVDPNTKYALLREQYIEIKDKDGLYQFSELTNSLLYTYSMLLLVSLPKLPIGWSLRVLTGWYWLYCLLVVVTYRASMTAILSRPMPRVAIDTLEELIDSKLTYGGWGEINRHFFESSPDEMIRRIGDNFETVDNDELAMDKVIRGKFAFYENTYFLKEAVVKRQLKFQKNSSKYTDHNNTSDIRSLIQTDRNLHIMKDCIINMPVSLGLQKNSPLRFRMDKLIRRVVEGGLVQKWLDDVMQKILRDKVEPKPDAKALMSFRKFYGAVVVLVIGYVVGIFVLIGEIFHHRYLKTSETKC